MPEQSPSSTFSHDAAQGGIQLPPEVELRLRALAGQGYKLAALRQVVDLSGAPISTAREYIENLLVTGQPAPETIPSPPADLKSET